MPFDEEGAYIPPSAPAVPINYDPDPYDWTPAGVVSPNPGSPGPGPTGNGMWYDPDAPMGEQETYVPYLTTPGNVDIYGDPYHGIEEDEGGGGGDGDGGGTPSNAWSETYTLQNAPSWWRGLTPLERNEETEYISLMNNMLPFLSPEDQRTVASTLYQMLPEYFASYDPNTWEKTIPAEYEIDPETGEPKLDENGQPIVKTPERVDLNPWARAEQTVPTLLMQEFQTTRAAEEQLKAMELMAKSMGIKDPNTLMGPGFRYLQQIAAATRSYGAAPNPEEGWTKAQKAKFMNTVDPLLSAAQASGNNPLAAYSVLARMLAQPTWSNAEQPMFPSVDPRTGELTWGTNPQMYG